jgi:hypothetical protein
LRLKQLSLRQPHAPTRDSILSYVTRERKSRGFTSTARSQTSSASRCPLDVLFDGLPLRVVTNVNDQLNPVFYFSLDFLCPLITTSEDHFGIPLPSCSPPTRYLELRRQSVTRMGRKGCSRLLGHKSARLSSHRPSCNQIMVTTASCSQNIYDRAAG